MSDRVSASSFQDGPTSVQGEAHQWWDNVFKKGEKLLHKSNYCQREQLEYVRETGLQTPRPAQKEGQEMLQSPK